MTARWAIGPATVFCAVIALCSPASAETLPNPQGPILLTVSGALTATNAEGAAHFDLEMLRQMETAVIETSTLWTDGVRAFEGVPLTTLLAELGVTDRTVEARAINDYAIEIPLSDPSSQEAIIAYAMDGVPMSRREKGPLWVIYPYDASAEFRTEVIFSRSIWQLDRIVVPD